MASILLYQIEPESDPHSSNDEEGQAEPLQARFLKDVYFRLYFKVFRYAVTCKCYCCLLAFNIRFYLDKSFTVAEYMTE